MQYRRHMLILVSITLACCLGLGPALAADFSAQVVSRTGSQKVQGKIYLQGEKMRQEFSTPEGLSINIFRPDKQMMWVIMPAQKMYMEMSFSQSDLGKAAMQLPQDNTKLKLLGKEQVNGYETEKYETTVTDKGKAVKHYIWVSKKLGVPIKMTSEDGTSSMEYRNIKEGNVPAATFEVPKGYQKMTMPPGMPQGMPRQ